MAIPDGQFLIIQGFGLQCKVLGGVKEVVVDLDKDAGANFHVFILLPRIPHPEGHASTPNLVRLLKDRDRVLQLAAGLRWLQKVVEIIRGR